MILLKQNQKALDEKLSPAFFHFATAAQRTCERFESFCNFDLDRREGSLVFFLYHVQYGSEMSQKKIKLGKSW